MERIVYRALKFVYNVFESDYTTLLQKAGLSSLELNRNRLIVIEVFKSAFSPIYVGFIHGEKFTVQFKKHVSVTFKACDNQTLWFGVAIVLWC